MSTMFSSEEVQAIREQYEELLQKERARREELEWALRMEMSRLRDAELAAKSAGETLQRASANLRKLIPSDEPANMTTVASRPAQALRPTPPPISPSMRAKEASFVETFNRTRNGRA